MNAIEQTISRMLAESGVSFSAVYRGEKKGALGRTDAMDGWIVTFTYGSQSEDFEFFTGLGLRAAPTEHDEARARMRLPGLSAKDIQTRNIYGRRYFAALEAFRKPKSPEPASVLHSLFMDAQACRQSFASWCSDFGYDTDSRNAISIYEACQNNGEKIRRVIPDGFLWSDIETALQDY